MPPTTKLIVKILGDFLQVGNNVVLNPRHIISIEWFTISGGGGYRIVIYCVHRNSNTYKVKTKEERDDFFERIGNALELMGAQGPEPKWEPGNEVQEVEQTEEDRALDWEVEAASSRLATAMERSVCMWNAKSLTKE